MAGASLDDASGRAAVEERRDPCAQEEQELEAQLGNAIHAEIGRLVNSLSEHGVINTLQDELQSLEAEWPAYEWHL